MVNMNLSGAFAMNASPDPASSLRTVYELRFHSLIIPGQALAFPCDAFGHVDLDGLSERDRYNYLYARAVMGRDLSAPAVQFCAAD
jgi:hypothetical protein